MQRKLLSIMVILAGALAPGMGSSAQGLEIDTLINHRFGVSIDFQAVIFSEIPVEAAVVYFQAEGDTRMNIGLAEVKDISSRQYRVVYTHQISDYAVPPFSTLHYYWELFLANEEMVTSPQIQYAYIDNRLKWKQIERDGIRIHWEKGDRQFGEDLIELVKRGDAEIQRFLPNSQLEDLDIFIYPDDEMLPTVLPLGSAGWVAGHADPKLGAIVIALPEVPEQRLLAEQRIPHELMHISLYRYTQGGYDNLPEWLKEGLASAVELHSNPEYKAVLENSNKTSRLLPLVSLCGAFPREISAAQLGYAQVQSFVQFLHRTYGTSGIQALIAAYADGLDCESGFEQALGRKLSLVEKDWRRAVFDQNETLIQVNNLLPWFFVLLAVLTAPLLVGLRRIFPQGSELKQNQKNQDK